jgi:hypothetical protein
VTEATKIVLGAVAALIVSVLGAIVGYVVRDSFDAPRLHIERVKYRISREQCKLSSENFYRFRTSVELRNFIEKAVPWSLADDIEDGEIEYDHAEDLLAQLPIRRQRLEKELPVVEQKIGFASQFLEKDTDSTRANVRDAIAFAAGMSSSETAEGRRGNLLLDMYAQFVSQPQAFARSFEGQLEARRNALSQESSIIQPLVDDLKACYDKGRPAPLPMVGNDLSKLPVSEFLLSVVNNGNTDGRLSYAVTYTSDGSDSYTINLVGQNPVIHRQVSRDLYSRIKGHEADELVYAIDRLRNQSEQVRRFYSDLTGAKGLSGRFEVSDIQRKKYEFHVTNLGAYN